MLVPPNFTKQFVNGTPPSIPIPSVASCIPILRRMSGAGKITASDSQAEYRKENGGYAFGKHHRGGDEHHPQEPFNHPPHHLAMRLDASEGAQRPEKCGKVVRVDADSRTNIDRLFGSNRHVLHRRVMQPLVR